MAPAHYGDAVTPDQAEVTMILIMGDIYLQLYRRTDRKNQSEHSTHSAAIVG